MASLTSRSATLVAIVIPFVLALAGSGAFGDSVDVVVPHALRVVHFDGYDDLAFDSTSGDTARVAHEPGYKYGTVAYLLVTWGDATRYISGVEDWNGRDLLTFRCPPAFVLSNSLRDSLAGEVRTVTLDFSVIRAVVDTAEHPRQPPVWWAPGRGEVLLHERVSEMFLFDVGVDSLRFRLLNPPE
jgi:hypothetical protein